MPERNVLVPDGLEGERVDSAIARLFGLSRTRAADLAADGGVSVNATSVGKSHRVSAGDMLEVALPTGPAGPVLEVVAGVADPPGPDEVVAVVDAVLRGVAEGDFAVTLERAAAFCRVLAIGRAHHADTPVEEDAGTALTRSAARLVRTAEQLEHVAHRWRASELG